MRTPPRRAVLQAGLGAGAALLFSGCGVDWRSVRIDTGASEKPPTFSANDLARFTAIEAISTLKEQADALATSQPAAGDLAASHTAQLAQLGQLPGPVPSASATPKNWPSTPTGSSPTDAAGLLAAELETANKLIAGLTGVSGVAVRLLASVALGIEVTSTKFAQEAKLAAPQALSLPSQAATVKGPLPEQVVKAAQNLVAAEDFAGYAYAPYAAALPEQARPEAATAMGQHTRAAQQLRALVHSAGTELPASPAAYAVNRPTDETAARAAITEVEKACAYAAGSLLATGDEALRPFALAALSAAAHHEWHWSGKAPSLPGLS